MGGFGSPFASDLWSNGLSWLCANVTEDQGLLEVLLQLARDCEPVRGAVLATDDGLVLAATGCLCSETAAASAAHLAHNVDQNLSLLVSTICSELLVWSPTLVWYLARLSGGGVLMVCAGSDCHAGGLRLAASEAARRLSASMGLPGI
jgi:predicted regulator of Ras-like GTPase activity (Roadblock/LC7/MglB family)